MNTSQLSQEDRAHLKQLVRSPGWLLLMQYAIIPAVQHANHTLAHIGLPEAQANAQRGVSNFLVHELLTPLYRTAELPNPFERHAQALMAELQAFAGQTPAPDTVEETQALETSGEMTRDDLPKKILQRQALVARHRVSYPV